MPILRVFFKTVRARAKQMQFWDHQRKKTYLPENFNFWSGDLKKSADSAFLGQKGLISETVTARAKRTKFWDHQWKKNVFDGKLIFFVM